MGVEGVIKVTHLTVDKLIGKRRVLLPFVIITAAFWILVSSIASAGAVSSRQIIFASTPQSAPHPLGFSIYTGLSTLLPSFKSAYSNANASDLLIDDNYNTPPRAYVTYWNHLQVFGRMVIANNYTELTSNGFSLYENNVAFVKALNFTKNDYVGYDAEDWALTPKVEQDNQANYTQLACNYVHAAGYKFAYTPEIDVPGWGQFARINWTCVDLLDLQEQFDSGNTAVLIQNVTQLLAASKAKNSNLVVFVQITMTGTSQSTMESDILAMANIQGVNGVMIEDECGTSSCSSMLATLVNYTKTIVGAGSTSTVPTTTVNATTSTIHTTSASTTTSSTLSTTTATSTPTTTSGLNNTRLGTPIVSPASPSPNTAFTIFCPAKNQSFDCINAYAKGLSNQCNWKSWSGNNSVFSCTGVATGSYTAECQAVAGTASNCQSATSQLGYSVGSAASSTSKSTTTSTVKTRTTSKSTTTISSGGGGGRRFTSTEIAVGITILVAIAVGIAYSALKTRKGRRSKAK